MIKKDKFLMKNIINKSLKAAYGINYLSHSSLWLDVSIMSCTMIDYARGIVSEIRSGIKTIAVRCVRIYVYAALQSMN